MHILAFTVAGQPYAIPARTVVEVLPLVPARPLPLLPDYMAGVFTYRGRMVPLVDLASRFGAAAGRTGGRLSTRVIVVEFAPGGLAGAMRLGLVADDVISIEEAAETDPVAPSSGTVPFLGRLVRLGGTTVQMVVVERLLPDDLLAGLATVASGAVGT
ncbi:MAG: purine-binding chemotaxis protein CheW [Planctomycetia bacterium]|nr:purine-binding chemotaxis protein CheW [Planctomycetia bacterium]